MTFLAVTMTSPFKTALPSMSKEGFIQVLIDANSPYAADGGLLYDTCLSKGHDPARWLAISKHEHQHGTDPNSVFVRSHTNSLTNARSVRDPSLKDKTQIITDPVRKSQYVKYQNVNDSLLDGIYRIEDPTYAYAGKTSIKDVISVWAPADDANNPASYAQDIVNSINTWSIQYPYAGGTPMQEYRDDPRFQWVPDQTEFGYGTGVQHGRSGQPIELLILHITEGTDSLNWLVTNHESSAHYLTKADGTPRAQMVLEADAAWTAGSREFNERGINIEVEMANVNSWTDDIMRQLAKTVAPILKRNGIPPVYVGKNAPKGTRGLLGHRDVPDGKGGWGGSTHHDDPGANFNWPLFIGYVNAEFAATPTPEPNPQPQPTPAPASATRYFPETGHYIGGGFKGYWENHGDEALQLFGYPISEEFRDDRNIVCQWFERARFEWQPDIAQNEYDVVLGLVGTESREHDKQQHPEAFEPQPAPAPTT